MPCFRDMIFCDSDCTNTRCPRHFGPDDREAARCWWSHDPDNAPGMFSDYAWGCADYERENKTEEERD